MSFQLPSQGSDSGRRSSVSSGLGDRQGVALMLVGLVISIAGIVVAAIGSGDHSTLSHYRYLPLLIGVVVLVFGAKRFSATLFCAIGAVVLAYGLYLAFGSGTHSAYQYAPLVIGVAMLTYGLNLRRAESEKHKAMY